MKLELAIKHKMQMLKRDWREYIKIEYPELFFNEADEYGDEDDENGLNKPSLAGDQKVKTGDDQ